VLRVGIGAGLAYRRFWLLLPSSGAEYDLGVYSQVTVQGELYPLQLVTRSPLSRLGLRVTYEFSTGLKTRVGQRDGLALDSGQSRIWGGLVFQLPRFSHPRLPCFEVHLGAAHHVFEVSDDPVAEGLSLTSLAVGGAVALPLWSFLVPEARAEYRVPLRAASRTLGRYDAGPASLVGYAVAGGLRGRVWAGVGYRASFVYERFGGDLPALAGGSPLTLRDAYLGGDLALTYEL
jgi:hypothetical protein